MQAETRRFEFSEGSSDKFWTITLSGSSHTVRFGRKGTSGQEQTKELGSESAARTSYDKLIAEKLKKGYRESGDPPSPREPAAPAPPPALSPITPNPLAETWAKIDGWLRKNAPKALATLKPAATPQQIADLEKQLGMSLPADLAASLQIHDGQTPPNRWIGLVDGWRLMSCSGIAKFSKGMAELLAEGDFDDQVAESDGPVKPVWWNPRWIPFLDSGSGNYLCLDMDPAEGGTQGQVIKFWHDDGDREYKSESLGDYLAEFADDLMANRYYVTDHGGLANH